jgi:hypothetical protein
MEIRKRIPTILAVVLTLFSTISYLVTSIFSVYFAFYRLAGLPMYQIDSIVTPFMEIVLFLYAAQFIFVLLLGGSLSSE